MSNNSIKSGSTVLILGANGFIGSHLVDGLVASGFKVRAFDRYTHSPQFKASDQIEIITGDFSDDIAITAAMEGADYLFHSFSSTTPFTSDADPYQDITLNLLRGVQLFERAVEKGIRKVVYISSGGAVYGHLAEQKSVSEDDAPKPVSPYGIGKLSSEYYLEYFNRKYGMDYVVYRLSNPYGPRQITKNNQGVIPAFISKLQHGETLSIIGDGTSTRDYIYIEDATDMIIDTFTRKTKYTIYNLGSGVQTSVNQIIGALEKQLKLTAAVQYTDAPKTFLSKSRLNVARFVGEFSPQPCRSLKVGIADMLS